MRISLGGHTIPVDVIERRYTAGIRNLFLFIEIVDRWYIYENVQAPPELIARGELNTTVKILNLELWEKLKTV